MLGAKFYRLLPEKENTGMAIVFMILVISTWLIQKLYNNYCLLLFVFLVAKGSQDD